MRFHTFFICLLWWMLPIRAVSAACDQIGTLLQVQEAVASAEQAFEEMEQTELLVSRDRALSILRCLEEEVRPSDAVSIFWLMALAQFTTDREQAASTLQAIWMLDSDHEIGKEFAPSENHPLAKLYQKAKFLPEGEYESVYPPKDGWALVNGVRGADRPLATPAIVQVFDSEGGIVETRYVLPEEVLPTWGPSPLDIPLVVRNNPKPWAVASVASTVVAGGFYTAALLTKRRGLSLDNPVPDSEVPAMQSRTNAFAGIATGAGIVAIGCGTTSLTFTFKQRGD